MFEFYHNRLAVPAAILYNKPMVDQIEELKSKIKHCANTGNNKAAFEYKEELNVLKRKYKSNEATFITVDNYKHQLKKSSLNKLTTGGNGRVALIEWDSVDAEVKSKVVQYLGYDPAEKTKHSGFEQYIGYDDAAYTFFNDFRKSTGEPLSKPQIERWTCQANIFNAIKTLLEDRLKVKMVFGKGVSTLWVNIGKAIQELDTEKYPHGLKKNVRRLQWKYEDYIKEGYSKLLHGNLENDCAKKIKNDVADWILAMYCLPIKMTVPMVFEKYLEKIKTNTNWPELTCGALNQWLNIPENRRIWVLARDGKKAYESEFGYHIKRKKDNWFANAWWVIDGSKLDWIHYFDNDIKMAAKLKIDPVIDIYSEKIIGWSYSETENMFDHFTAIKMAANNSQCRPYLFTYDNQSGHKSPKMKELYTKLVAKDGGTHYPHKAYRSSNPIEQLFGRLQQQVLNQMWFSDKQSITARKADSKPNLDFIKANKHRLMSKAQLMKAWEMCVNLWNNSPHPLIEAMTRAQVYAQEAPMKEELNFLDMVDIFWINETKPITYKKGGIMLQVGKNRYEFEVLDSEDKIDLEFRRKYIGAKFIVKYDPEHLNNFVQLYSQDANGDRTLIANAQPKREHEQIPALMQEGDKNKFLEDYGIIEKEFLRDMAAIDALMQRTGITPERMIDEQELKIKMGGDLPKNLRSEVESEASFIDGL